MNIARIGLSVATLVVGASSTLLGMNNSDVIRMKQADLSEQTILMAISKEPADYDTDADALIELKKAGVPEVVIQQMVASQRSGKRSSDSESSSTASNPAPGAEPAPAETRPNFLDQDFPSIAPPLVEIAAGQEYFTRSTIHVEDGEYVGTNYARGGIVPINTPVRVDAIRGNSISVHRVDTGDKIEIKNVEKYTMKPTTALGRLLLAAEQTPLDRLPPDLASSIKNGEMRKGMTKEQVLMARGYPPSHETPSIDGDRWVYWSSRFVKHTIVFANGRLVEGRGIN